MWSKTLCRSVTACFYVTANELRSPQQHEQAHLQRSGIISSYYWTVLASTATLQTRKQVAGLLGVSHFLIFTATEKSSYLRIAKTPRVGSVTKSLYRTPALLWVLLNLL